MLRISDGSNEVGGDVRAALDQGGSRGASLHGQAREVVGRSPLVPRSDVWDLAPLAASSRGGLASCGGMRREPDVRQEFVERAGTLMRGFSAMDGVRIKTLIDLDSRWFDKAVAEIKERRGTAPGIVFGDFRGRLDNKDIDTLVVGMPDHWHAIPTILGCQAGKPSMSRSPTRTTVATHANSEGWCGTHPYSDSTVRKTGSFAKRVGNFGPFFRFLAACT
jgi:hypothetical protein